MLGCLTIDILEPKFQNMHVSTHHLPHVEGFKKVFCKEMKGRHVASRFPTAPKSHSIKIQS